MQTANAALNSHAAPSAALLRGTPLARSAPEASALGSFRRLAKDEEVFVEGDRAAFFYKVQSGAVRTFKLLSDGRRQIDAFHLPGDIFGIEPGEEHRFSAEAVGDATVISYRRSNLNAETKDAGDIPNEMIPAVLLSLVRAQNHMLLLGRKNAVEKIASFLLDLSGRTANTDQIDLPMSRTDIADHLGLTIETVSRSLTQLERQGTIELPAHRRCIVLRNKPALERLDM
ncbi:helix-turn-helix domain-containing protein [Microvirga terrestris]|uniref:Helix-turn-helix domain-containing protein n=1 Tax=Microvirga terrestris TaxID=2791024 RepID=A0ABS0HUV5_9HYPH|nr:helix-turn-helix domain-containing protein [Microvirga terrestris]MBF9197272.1 helix-turn-helix domain-containing protein [Microvirga terrestris]